MIKYIGAFIGSVCLGAGIIFIVKGVASDIGWQFMLGACLVGFSYGWAYRE